MEKSVTDYVWEETITVVDKLTDLGKFRIKFRQEFWLKLSKSARFLNADRCLLE